MAQSNPEKLREIVDVLTNHCINVSAAWRLRSTQRFGLSCADF